MDYQGLPDITVEAIDRFNRHMPRGADATLLILKGHLLIEELINGLLEKMFPKSEFISAANLRLHQKINILKASYADDTIQRVLAIAETLNAPRNKLAHHLEPQGIDTRVAAFTETVLNTMSRKHELIYDTDSAEHRLIFALAAIYGQMQGIADITVKGGVEHGLLHRLGSLQSPEDAGGNALIPD